jgi:hypothetical protein
MWQVSTEGEVASEERIATTKKVVVEAFASHGVVLSKDDPIVALGTVLELALVRGTQEHSATFSRQMDDLVRRIATFNAEARSELGAEAARFVEAIRTEGETELQTRRKAQTDDAQMISLIRVEFEKGVAAYRKAQADDANAAGYRAEQAVKRALAISLTPKWFYLLIGACAGGIFVLVALVVYSVFWHGVR